MKQSTKKELDKQIKIAKGTPKNNDINSHYKDMIDAKKSGKQESAEIAISGYKKWKRS